MNVMQVVVGITYSLLSILLTPIYIRVIYIFISRSKYRCYECYRIMIQIGIVQCLMAPGIFFVGVTHLHGEDPFSLASSTMKLMTVGVGLEALLSFVLALNRLKIICELQYSHFVHTIPMIASWTFGSVYLSFLFTPWCNYIVVPGEFLSKYDMSKPYTKILATVGSSVLVISICLTLLVYLAIVFYLFWMNLKLKDIPKIKTERSLLLYAGIRFVVDISLTFLYNFGNPPHRPVIDFPVFVGYILNNLCLPPCLYLYLHKELREKFFRRMVTTRRVHSVSHK